ncbi:MAG: ABC transporter ATP-binding protein, partial [Actinomycetota bacterium]
VALPLVLVLRAVQQRLVRAHGFARERNGEMLGALAEVVSGAATIRAYGAGDAIGGNVRAATEAKAHSQIKAALYGAFLFPSGEVFNVFTIVSVVGVGIWRGPESGLTAGALIGFVFLTYRFLEPVAEFTEIIDQTQTAVAGMHRVLTVLDMPIGPPEPATPTPLPTGTLGVAIERVTFAYPSRQDDDRADGSPVLHGIDVEIPGGQQIAIVGETGSGKSTLGRLVARFADPSEGRISIGGVDLRDVAGDDLRSRLTVVSQEPFLLDATIGENLRFARPDADVGDFLRTIEELDVGDWLAALPDGLDTGVGQRGEGLSAGERQLIALVRVGLADPDVLILDEATSSVDALTEVRIARALDHLAAGRTTIAIAHRLSTAARADRVLVLDDGRVVQDGHHRDLVAVDGVYRDLYEAWVSATSV